MEQKNSEYDEFDKMLFEHFSKNKEVPYSTTRTIEQALSQNKKKHISDIIKRIISIIVTLALLSTGVVFAKDIIIYIRSYFTNTNEGIETAANNGYIQNVDSDFIESNGLSAKIDNILLDDNNLDISFIYKYTNEKIEAINFSDILIKDENDNILYYISDDYNIEYFNNRIGETLSRNNSIENLNDGIFRESILISAKNKAFPKSSKLKITIKKAYLIKNSTSYTLNGLWEFNFDLSSKFITRENYTYTLSNNSYITDYTATLNDTSLNIQLYLNTNLDTIYICMTQYL